MLQIMRLWLLLLVSVTSLVSGDPDLRQLLHIWRPTPALNWGNVTSECAQAMDSFSLALSQRQQWASLMLDASGQAYQYLTSNDFWLGSRPQCEQVNEEWSNLTTTNDFPVAVYRILKLKVNVSEPLVAPQQLDRIAWILPRHIWMGVCVPGACGDAAQVSALLRQMLDAAQPENNFRDVQLVHVKILPSNFSGWGETSTSLLILLCTIAIGLIIIGTIVDTLEFNTTKFKFIGTWHSVLVAFSLPRNAHKLFHVTSSSEGSIPALHGIRTLSMAWVILSHALVYFLLYSENPTFRRTAENSLFYQLLTNGFLSVESFFFITGVLLSYVLLRYRKSNNKQDTFSEASSKFIWISVYRMLRLMVPYVFTILLTVVTFKQVEVDSLFETGTFEVMNCPKSWWKNVLYISNLFPLDDMCVIWGWYLGADTQLYIVAAAILLLYVNGYSRSAITIGGVILTSSWIAVATVSYVAGFIPSVEQPFGLYDVIYLKPWGHVAPVWVGLVTGWLLHRGIFVKSKLQLALGWILCIFCMCVTVFAAEFSARFNLAGAATYTALSNTFWSLCLAWIVLACSHKCAGWIGSILESPMFIPFGRATFCTYLIHYPVIEWVFMMLEGPLPISRGLGVAITTGLIFASFILGAIVSLVFESPVIQLLKLLPLSHRSEKKYVAPSDIDMQTVAPSVVPL